MTESPPVQLTVVRTCVTCAHHRQTPASSTHTCTRTLFSDPVTGRVEESSWSCSAERASTTWHKGYTSSDPCGPEGKHWVSRPVAPPLPEFPPTRVEREPGLLDCLLRPFRRQPSTLSRMPESRGSYLPSPNQILPPRT